MKVSDRDRDIKGKNVGCVKLISNLRTTCSDNSVKGFLISVHCCSLDIFALNRWTINCNNYGNSASDEVTVA